MALAAIVATFGVAWAVLSCSAPGGIPVALGCVLATPAAVMVGIHRGLLWALLAAGLVGIHVFALWSLLEGPRWVPVRSLLIWTLPAAVVVYGALAGAPRRTFGSARDAILTLFLGSIAGAGSWALGVSMAQVVTDLPAPGAALAAFNLAIASLPLVVGISWALHRPPARRLVRDSTRASGP